MTTSGTAGFLCKCWENALVNLSMGLIFRSFEEERTSAKATGVNISRLGAGMVLDILF